MEFSSKKGRSNEHTWRPKEPAKKNNANKHKHKKKQRKKLEEEIIDADKKKSATLPAYRHGKLHNCLFRGNEAAFQILSTP